MYLDLIDDSLHHRSKVGNLFGDDARVFTELRDQRHVANSRAHHNEKLLLVHALGAFLVQPLCVCVCVCTYIHTYICIHTHTQHRQTDTHTHIDTHTPAHTHTHTNAHTHTWSMSLRITCRMLLIEMASSEARNLVPSAESLKVPNSPPQPWSSFAQYR